MTWRLGSAAMVLAVAASGASAQETSHVIIGAVDSLTNAPIYIAQEMGYYAEEGIEVELAPTATSGDVAVLLATNQIQITGGGVGPTFYNSIAQGMPISVMVSRNVSPYDHYIVARPEIADSIKEPSDLEGLTVALNATGSIAVYELARALESSGLTLDDVNELYIPFSQMAPALTTGAADAALMISPMFDTVHAEGLGVKVISLDRYIEPQPVTISFLQMNSDWANENEDVARGFVRATLRATRDYCDAYHSGDNRDDIIAILAERSDIKDADFIDTNLEWQQLDPWGRVFEESMLDVQDFFAERGAIENPVTWEQMAPPAWIAEVAAELGDYTPPAGSDLPGCQ